MKKTNKHPKRRSVPWTLHTFLDGEPPPPPPLAVCLSRLPLGEKRQQLAGAEQEVDCNQTGGPAPTLTSRLLSAPRGHTHTKSASSLSLRLTRSSARRPGGSGTTDRHKGNKHQQQSLQEIPVQDGCAKKGADCHLKMDNGPDSVWW